MIPAERWQIICDDWRNVGIPPDTAAIVTDPPYGIRISTHGLRLPSQAAIDRGTATCKWRRPPHWTRGREQDSGIQIHGDDEIFSPAALISHGVPYVLWGVDRWDRERRYPGKWLAWVKLGSWRERRDSFADVEFALAAPATRSSIKAWNQRWKGCVRDLIGEDRDPSDGSHGYRGRHPTQKPVALLEWCLRQIPIPVGGLIFDPYTGSGPVGVAALRAGYRYLGVEIDPLFAETARQRLSLIETNTPPPPTVHAPFNAD